MTSSLSIDAIAVEASEHVDRIIGCHWWYPPCLLCPGETVRGEETSKETVKSAKEFVEQIDRDPIIVK